MSAAMADTSIPDGSFIVPAGENVHSGLRSSFVKMDGLLAYLDEDQFNGYVLLHGLDEGTGADGLLLFQAGKVVGASYGDSQGDRHCARLLPRIGMRGVPSAHGQGADQASRLSCGLPYRGGSPAAVTPPRGLWPRRRTPAPAVAAR